MVEWIGLDFGDNLGDLGLDFFFCRENWAAEFLVGQGPVGAKNLRVLRRSW